MIKKIRALKHIHAKILSLHENFWYNSTKQSDILYAFYDLAVSPATFDIVKFLLFAELERKNINCSSLHVVIVSGPAAGFRAGDLESYIKSGTRNYDNHYMQWRLGNILLPCCRLIPSCRQVTVCSSRKEARALQVSLAKHVFPKGYTVRFPRENYDLRHIIIASSKGVALPGIQVPAQARRFVNDWINSKTGRRKIISISLRECAYQQARNSNLGAWGAFARSLDRSVYYPVVIRDIETAFKPLPPEFGELPVFSEASWDVELRAALYELSYLNMSVNSGPNTLCLNNRKTRCLTFKMLTPSCGATTEKFFRGQGIKPGFQFKHTTPFQRLVWEDDRFEVLHEAFKKMCDNIES